MANTGAPLASQQERDAPSDPQLETVSRQGSCVSMPRSWKRTWSYRAGVVRGGAIALGLLGFYGHLLECARRHGQGRHAPLARRPAAWRRWGRSTRASSPMMSSTLGAPSGTLTGSGKSAVESLKATSIVPGTAGPRPGARSGRLSMPPVAPAPRPGSIALVPVVSPSNSPLIPRSITPAALRRRPDDRPHTSRVAMVGPA
jgi:hypothetical protein